MKKALTITILSCAALLLAACGGKSENVETAVDRAETEEHAASSDGSAADAADYDDDTDVEPFEGIITDISGSVVTLRGDDGGYMSFDISGAELFEDDGPLLRGSLAEADYYVVDDADVYAAETFMILNDIEQQADAEDRDPVIYGTLQVMETNDLQILDEAGYERSFDNQMSREVSFTGIKVGDMVAVTYTGSLLDEDETADPYAIKVVALDAIESEEAQANYIIGSISDLYSDGVFTLYTGVLSLDIEYDSSAYTDLGEGDEVKVYYDGQLSGMAVRAAAIEQAYSD